MGVSVPVSDRMAKAFYGVYTPARWASWPWGAGDGTIRFETAAAGLVLIVVLFGLAGLAGWLLLRRSHRAQLQATRLEHLAQVGTLASGLVHEIRNPLNAMRIQLALLRRRLENISDPEARDSALRQVEKLEAEVQRLEDLAREFLAFAKPAESDLQMLDPVEVVREVADFIQPEANRAGVEVLVVHDGQVPPVLADKNKIKQALLNLAINAKQAMPEGGRMTFSISREGDTVKLEVSDTGVGIPAEYGSRIFDAFFSTKESGTGLGLAIVKQTVEEFGGTIDFDSTVGKGTTFRITLPAARQK